VYVINRTFTHFTVFAPFSSQIDINVIALAGTVFKYEYTMDQEVVDASAYAVGDAACALHSPDDSTFMREMTSWRPF